MINTTMMAADGQLVPVADISTDIGTPPFVVSMVEEEADETGEDDPLPVSRRNQRGMVSAEWAVGIIAAIAIAGVLLSIVTSGPVKAALLKVILMIIGMFTQNAHFLKL